MAKCYEPTIKLLLKKSDWIICAGTNSLNWAKSKGRKDKISIVFNCGETCPDFK